MNIEEVLVTETGFVLRVTREELRAIWHGLASTDPDLGLWDQIRRVMEASR